MSYGDFLRGLLKDPRGVSAPTPSSPALAAAMAERVDPLRPGLVVELGAGTGVVTEALLARAPFSLSFGPMTWPHLLARVLLAEQIYRAQQLLAGHPYHRA